MSGLDRLIIDGLSPSRPFGVGLNASFEGAVTTPATFKDYLSPEALRAAEKAYSEGNAEQRADAFMKMVRHEAFLKGPK